MSVRSTRSGLVGVVVAAAVLAACSGSVTPPTVTLPSSTAATTGTVASEPTATSTSVRPEPGFEFRISPASETTLGSSWREGCPVGPDSLSMVLLTHWNMDGEVVDGELVVATDVADDIVQVFSRLFDARYPIERMRPVQLYESDDRQSMAANNTSGFNCRFVAGTTRWSEHAYGLAIDINPVQNPYVGTNVSPPAGAAFLDRTDVRPGMVVDGDVVVRAFEEIGWPWGGDWTTPDYQHFSSSGR